jgi:DNA invertase Pin-like site-specific DNA recombinase
MSCNREKNQTKNKLVIELIGSTFDKVKIKSIAKTNGASDTQFYQWKNHLVLYTQLDQINDF